jgi:small subunit ribosomal protein S17
MSLTLAKCVATPLRNTIRVLVPQLKFDSYLNMHFRENDSFMVADQTGDCKPGDWCLVRELPQRVSLDVKHQVEKVVYKSGQIVDPMTGQQSYGYLYKDDYERLRRQNQQLDEIINGPKASD